jgi:hypothetical protein
MMGRRKASSKKKQNVPSPDQTVPSTIQPSSLRAQRIQNWIASPPAAARNDEEENHWRRFNRKAIVGRNYQIRRGKRNFCLINKPSSLRAAAGGEAIQVWFTGRLSDVGLLRCTRNDEGQGR